MARDLYLSDGKNIAELAAIAASWRDKFEIQSCDKVDIIAILEFKLPRLWPSFHVKVVPDTHMKSNAKTSISPPAIIIKKSVYISAAHGHPVSRFILAHELGHLILHRKFENEEMHDTEHGYEENISQLNALESIEDQASIFCRFFMAPPALAHRFIKDKEGLSKAAGIPKSEAATSITLSKRQEFFDFDLPR
ncbi:MAG: ImmA/IrrE family metallo-endopeptidase [Mesorhizobium sp.]|nr:MAG: ImmA/IrrE family metallo-endopeptidase [Mesorhizobium sp.]